MKSWFSLSTDWEGITGAPTSQTPSLAVESTPSTNEEESGNSQSLDPSSLSTNENLSSLVSQGSSKNGAGGSNNDQVDTYIAQALHKLSMKERDQVYHELHGVDDVIEETPSFVQEHMHQLEVELDMMKDSHPKARAFRMALEEASSASQNNQCYYVSDPRVRLKFLRAEAFDAHKAADRMVRFFDLKLFLFGSQQLLNKNITMSDLSKEDRNSIHAGFIQLLPVRDRAGRAIIMLIPTFQSYSVAENMVRIGWHLD